MGGAKRVRILTGLVRIVIAMRGGNWHTADKLEPDIRHCKNGLLKLFVAAALGQGH
jgi:hypothetical protein